MKSWLKLLPLLLLLACKDEPARHVSHPKAAIYHWKTVVTLDKTDSLKLDSLGVERMYLRFFDIDRYEDKLKPLGVVEWKTLPPADLDIVPCVYITNRAMAFLPDTAAASLAAHIFSKIKKLAVALPNTIREIQLDCDWSDETREKYFTLLGALKLLCEEEKWLLSATIRLHQVKYFETAGIPPVHRGMLMYYNMGELNSPDETNSILNPATGEKYLENMDKYPLELDLALPLFSWAVQFRGNEFFALRSAWTREDLQNDTLFLQEGENWFVARDNGLFRGEYILKNDRVRMEEVSPDLDIHVLNTLYSRLKNLPNYLTLFHYNPNEIENYAATAVQEIYSHSPE